MDGKHHTTPWRGARAQRAAALVFGLSIGLAAVVGPAQADKVGVAAAVNPDAFSSLSGTPNKQLNIGKSIFFNERINTTNSGLVQVLLVDGSTFTVGPNSNLVIDKFVYDPRKKTGELVATFSKGTMRFIGGKLSKNEGGVTVNTPDGALAIRGGMFQGSTSRGVYSFLFGDSLTFRGRNGQTRTVYETGYSIDLNGGTNVRPTTREDINTIISALSSPNTNTQPGGVPVGNTPNVNTPDFFQNDGDPDQIINAVTQTQLQDEIQNTLNSLKSKQTTNGAPPPQTPTTPPQGPGQPGPEEPVKVEGVFNGYAAGFVREGSGKPDFIGTLSPQDDFGLSLTPSTETSPDEVSAYLKTYEFDPTKPLRSLFVNFLASRTYEIGYTGSEYLDNHTFSASNEQVRITERILWFSRTTDLPGTGSFVSSAPGTALCDACEFVKWGRWGSGLGSEAQLGGMWVAGDIASAGDLNELGNQRATATYAGSAVGDVYQKVQGQWGQPTQESGRMEMSWDFAARSGRLDIYDFAGKDFGGDICGTGSKCFKGNNHFAGSLSGSGLKGAAAGSFVRSGGDPAAGVIGNFGVGKGNWKADGIFAGSRGPIGQ
jgi:FecR-like protein